MENVDFIEGCPRKIVNFGQILNGRLLAIIYFNMPENTCFWQTMSDNYTIAIK